MASPRLVLLTVAVLAGALPACTKKTEEPAAAEGPPREAKPPTPEAVRRGVVKGTINKPLYLASSKELQQAITATGWKPGGFSEMESGGTVTRTYPVQKDKLVGTVTWYKTNDKEMIHASMVQGWPSAEDGDVVLVVKLANENRRSDARRLLTALVGD